MATKYAKLPQGAGKHRVPRQIAAERAEFPAPHPAWGQETENRSKALRRGTSPSSQAESNVEPPKREGGGPDGAERWESRRLGPKTGEPGASPRAPSGLPAPRLPLRRGE